MVKELSIGFGWFRQCWAGICQVIDEEGRGIGGKYGISLLRQGYLNWQTWQCDRSRWN